MLVGGFMVALHLCDNLLVVSRYMSNPVGICCLGVRRINLTTSAMFVKSQRCPPPANVFAVTHIVALFTLFP